MSNLLWFEWLRDRDGYSVVEFDPAEVVWDGAPPENKVAAPVNASPTTVQLLEKYRMGLWTASGAETIGGQPFHIVEPVGDEAVKYKPLEEYPGLFMDFSETALSPVGVKAFADQFGQLHHPSGPDILDDWYRDIRRMKKTVLAWKEAETRGSLRPWVADFGQRVEGVFEDRGRVPATIELRNTGDPLKPFLHVVPADLLAAMWLQLAQRVGSNTGLRRCAWCPKWFEYGTGTGKRKTGLYCSNKCNNAAYNDRRDRPK